MQIKTHEPSQSTATDYNIPFVPAKGKESLASSSDAALLQRYVLDLTCKLFLVRRAAVVTDTSPYASLFPVLVPAVAQQIPVENREQSRLTTRLRASFEADPLEDGMDHPAEEIIGEALRSKEDQHALEWLRGLSLDAAHPSFAASVLHCLGRQTHPGTSSWRADLVRDGLAVDNLEIRDAAVQAAESWGGSGLLDILGSHSESVPWLRNYIQEVIEDLEE